MKKRIFTNPVFRDKVKLVKSAEESNGEFSLFEIEVAPAGGNSLHRHDDYTEKFKVIEGELRVHLNGTEHLLKDNESITVPANGLHYFCNKSSKPAKFLIELRPAQPGFEKAIAISYGLAEEGLVTKKGIPKKFSHLALLVLLSKTTPSGLARLMMPLFRWKARKSSQEQAFLIQKYC